MKSDVVHMKSQIYWSVVYDHTNNKLMMGQVPLAIGLPYEKRLELVKSFDQKAKSLNMEQVRFGYYTINEETDLSEFNSEELPF